MRPPLSASNLSAAALCPAKPRMESGLADSDSAYSRRGTNLHPYFLTGKSYNALSPEDRELMQAADALSQDFLTLFREHVGLAHEENATSEHEVDLAGLVPGHPDTVLTWRGGDFVAILDLKSGVMEVEEAPSNLQLSAYSALVWQRARFAACGVAIVQPNALGQRLTTAIYTSEQMPGVLREIARIHAASITPDAPLVAGDEQCRFCKATAICPAWKARYMAPVVINGALAIEQVSNDDLAAGAAVITACRGKRGDEWMSELRRRVEAGTIPGWSLRNTGDVTELVDSTGFYAALKSYFIGNTGFTATGYDECRAMTWGKLTNYIQALTNMSETKAKEFIAEMSAPFVKKKPKAKSCVMDKPAKKAIT